MASGHGAKRAGRPRIALLWSRCPRPICRRRPDMPRRSRKAGSSAEAWLVPLPGFDLDLGDDDILAAFTDLDAPDEGEVVEVAEPEPLPPPPDPFETARERFALATTPALSLEPRAYQRAALQAWIAND